MTFTRGSEEKRFKGMKSESPGRLQAGLCYET